MNKLEIAAKQLLKHWETIDWKDGKMTGDYMHDLREALADQEESKPVCNRCNGTGIVPDGFIDNIGGMPLESVIECTQDCPDCTAPQPLLAPVRNRDADRKRFPDEAFNRWLDEGISDAGHTIWDTVTDIDDAWAAWEARPYYAIPAHDAFAVSGKPMQGTAPWHHPECEGECIACLIERAVKDAYGTQGLEYMLRHINAAQSSAKEKWPLMGYGNVAVGGGKQPDGTSTLLYMDMGETRGIGADTTDLFAVGSTADPSKLMACIYFKDGAAIQQTIDILHEMQAEIGYASLADQYCWACGAKQAQIDRLMLEYCPDEMTHEQMQEWGNNQRPAEQSEQEPVAFADKYGNVMKAKEKLTSTNVRDNWYDRPLYEKAAFDADLYSVAGKLALELECLLLDTKDLSVVSKWWDSAHDALEQWRTIKYAAPVRTKDLTDAEIADIGTNCGTSMWSLMFARAVIAAYKEKNK